MAIWQAHAEDFFSMESKNNRAIRIGDGRQRIRQALDKGRTTDDLTSPQFTNLLKVKQEHEKGTTSYIRQESY